MHIRFRYLDIILLVSFTLLCKTQAFAGSPPWTFSAPNPNQALIARGQTETVTYTVTNLANRTKNLVLKTTAGLRASACNLPSKGSTCTLTLTINGNSVPQDGIHGGPVLCEQSNPNQCYQPPSQHQLNIALAATTVGHLVLMEAGTPINSLSLRPGESGTLVLQNTGWASVNALTTNRPFGWQAYFINNCPATLGPQQSCTITFTIPSITSTGVLNPMTIQASNADNSLVIPVSIQVVGALRCWGVNFYGQLGVTTNINTTTANNSPINMPALQSGVMAITGGEAHNCALLDTGGVKCWGRNYYGQLGSTTNSGTNNSNLTPLDVQGLSSGVVAISAGYDHTCALLNTGGVKCWGWNRYGQLGSPVNNGTNNVNNTPIDVQTLSSGVRAISAGYMHTCALLNTGAVKCWGLNQYGQLGSTTNSGNATAANPTPLDVQTLSSGVAAIASGYRTSCALLQTGAVKCWGWNQHGQVGSTVNSGNGAAANNSPLDVQTLNANVTAISGGGSYFCALMNTGGVRCWGWNRFGTLGATNNNNTDNANNSPLNVLTLNSGVITIAASADHTCGLLDTGAVKCWGRNLYGVLGSTTNSGNATAANPTPLNVQTLNAGVGAIFDHNFSYTACAIIP